MKVHTVTRFAANVFLLEDDNLCVIDTGLPGSAPAILAKIGLIGRKPEDVRIIVITHAHADHFGSAAKLLSSCRNADLGCHPLEAAMLRQGGKHVSPGLTGLTRAFEQAVRKVFPLVRLHGAAPTVSLDDGVSLRDWGVAGRVVHTPGHTGDSISVLLDDGSAFVGDLAVGRYRFNRRPTAATMALDRTAVGHSLCHLLECGARVLYPAHGRPIGEAELHRVVEEWRGS